MGRVMGLPVAIGDIKGCAEPVTEFIMPIKYNGVRLVIVAGIVFSTVNGFQTKTNSVSSIRRDRCNSPNH